MFECIEIVEDINEGKVKPSKKTGSDTNPASHNSTTPLPHQPSSPASTPPTRSKATPSINPLP